MSLLHMSGFEGAPKRIEAPTTGVTYAVGGRTGRCMVLPAGHGCTVGIANNPSEIVVGVAYKALNGYGDSSPGGINLQSTGVGDEFRVQLSSGGALNVIQIREYGSTAVIANLPGLWLFDTYIYLEIHVKMHATTGFFKVWANGNQVVNFTGDTIGGGAFTGFNGVNLYGPLYGGNAHVDDFYLLDGTDGTATQGRAFNAPLGQPRIESLALVGTGPTQQWVGSDGDSVNNHLLIDEVPPSEVDYVESSTTGDRDLYDFAAPVLVGDILAVDVSTYAWSPDGGNNPIKTVSRSGGGGISVGPGVTPSTSPKLLTDGPRGKDADGVLWTPTSVAVSHFGFEVG